MWTGEPPTEYAPWPDPQYVWLAIWPPQTKSTDVAVLVNVTVTSAVLSPPTQAGGLCVTAEMFVIVPP